MSSFIPARAAARAAVALSLVALSLVALAVPASAHVTIPEGTVEGGGEGAVIHLRVPHGCEGQPTDSVEVQIPEGVVNVTPEAVAGWTVYTNSVATEPYDLDGATLTERTSVVRWSGGTSPTTSTLTSASWPSSPMRVACSRSPSCSTAARRRSPGSRSPAPARTPSLSSGRRPP